MKTNTTKISDLELLTAEFKKSRKELIDFIDSLTDEEAKRIRKKLKDQNRK